MACGRGHTRPVPWSCFPSSLFLFKLTLAPRTKTSNKPQEGEKSLESESCGPNTTIHRPGRQAFNTIPTHAIVACSSGMAQRSSKPPPSPPGLALPPGFFVHATPVIYSLNDKTQTSTHSSLESEDNHITADDRDANQTWARTQGRICINPNSAVSSSTARLLFFHRGAKKYTKLWNARVWIEGDRKQG